MEENNITGPIPPELGGLSNLEVAFLHDNHLTGSLPPTLGNLPSIRVLNFANNDLRGGVPPNFGNLATLEHLYLSHNPRMSGTLPRSILSLERLTGLLASGTGLCAPRDAAFVEWLETVRDLRVSTCGTLERSTAYLTQAVQSLDFPVPLVASEPALLRVFVTTDEETVEEIPPVRATFYQHGAVAHVIDIPQGSATIPVEIEEGDLAKSANADVPARLVQPGLEMVVEIDPDSTLAPGLDVQRRIPATGRQAVDVRAMPTMQLTVVPLLLETQPDSSILEFTDGLTGQDAVFWETRTWLPVGDLDVAVHDPVWTSTNDIFSILNAMEALRVMEGRPGHHLGTMWGLEGAAGVADLGGWTVVVPPDGDVIAHELGHNIGLGHAPCGNPPGVDTGFPSPAGAIGSWGYDFRDGGRLVPPSHKDLMSYCHPLWISDYFFSRALRRRLAREAEAEASGAPSTQALLLWGRLDENGDPVIEPAFIVDAPPVLPAAPGDYQLTGRTPSGEALFAFSFDMKQVSHGGTASFAFALPARPEWAGRLATITLSGPAGSVTLDGESDRAMTILRDPRTGQVRAILRDTGAQAAGEAASVAGRGLEVLFSRGVPEEAQWRR